MATYAYLHIANASFINHGQVGVFNDVWLQFVQDSSGAVVSLLDSSGNPVPNLTFTVGGNVFTFPASSLQITVSGSYPNFNYVLSGNSSNTIGGFPAHIGGLTFSNGSTAFGTIGQNPGVTIGTTIYSLTSSSITYTTTPPCFAAGTLIRTPSGDVPVETLKAGDWIVTASGEQRRVKWIGHTDVDLRLLPPTKDGRPVRIAADAFGPGRPSQDLVVSWGHSLGVNLVGEVLIMAGDLLNGATIAWDECDSIQYWHVELDSHDILIANNMPAESYLAMANRDGFEEAADFESAASEGRELTHADFCRPVVTDRKTLAFVRRRLLTRAKELGWTASSDPDLRLQVDGVMLSPAVVDGGSQFVFPAAARDVRLLSNAFVPSRLGLPDDRRLGVMLTSLAVSAGDGDVRTVALDDPRLDRGAHAVEGVNGARWRWTDGDLVLNPDLWAGLAGDVNLRLSHDSSFPRRWTPPAPSAADALGDEPQRLSAVA